jgi:hypothetical protein
MCTFIRSANSTKFDVYAYGFSPGELYQAYRTLSRFPQTEERHAIPAFWVWDMRKVLRFFEKERAAGSVRQ